VRSGDLSCACAPVAWSAVRFYPLARPALAGGGVAPRRRGSALPPFLSGRCLPAVGRVLSISFFSAPPRWFLGNSAKVYFRYIPANDLRRGGFVKVCAVLAYFSGKTTEQCFPCRVLRRGCARWRSVRSKAALTKRRRPPASSD